MVWLNPLFVWGPWPAFGVPLHMSFPLVAYRILWGPQNIRVLHHRSCAFTAIGGTWGQIETKRNLEMKFVMNVGLACSGCPPKPSTGSWPRWSSPLFCSGMKWLWKKHWASSKQQCHQHNVLDRDKYEVWYPEIMTSSIPTPWVQLHYATLHQSSLYTSSSSSRGSGLHSWKRPGVRSWVSRNRWCKTRDAT